MKQTIKSILAFAALMLCGGAWAARPVATWTDFSSVTGTSQVQIDSAEGATYKLTVPSGNTLATDGALVIGSNDGITVNYSGTKVVTVELDVADVPTTDCALITTMIGTSHAVCLAANNGTLSQHWTYRWDDDYGSGTWPTTGRHTVSMTYNGRDASSATRGTQTYVDGNSAIAVKNGLISTDTNIAYIRLGAQYANGRPATGMKIYGIRIYDSRLSDAEIAAAYMDAGHPFLVNFKTNTSSDESGWINFSCSGGANQGPIPNANSNPNLKIVTGSKGNGNFNSSFATASSDSFANGSYVDINGVSHTTLPEEIAVSLGLTGSIPENVYKTGISQGARYTSTETISGLLTDKKYVVYAGIGVKRVANNKTFKSGFSVETSGYSSVEALEYVVTSDGDNATASTSYQSFNPGEAIVPGQGGMIIIRMRGVTPNASGNIVFKSDEPNVNTEPDDNGKAAISFVAVAPYEPKFPEYTATVTENCDFSAITWTPALPADRSMAKLVLTTTGEPTINVASAFSCAEMEVVGSAKFTNQNNLSVGKLNIPQDSTVTFTTATTFSGDILGEGTLKWDVGVNEDCTSDAKRIASDKFAEFAGMFHVVSGRYKPSASINSAVTIKVTHGGQIWLTNGQTFNNAFELSGRGWGGTGNDVEQTALRFEGVLGATATVKIVDDSNHTPTAIGSTSDTTVQGKFSGSGDLELRGSGALAINEPYHPDFTGKVTSTSDFTLGKNSGLSANSPIKFGSEIVIPANKTFSLNGGNLNGASFANNNKYVVNSKITISNGARLTTVDGAYRFSDVTIPSGATCYTTFKWKKGWLFDALNIPSGSTLQMEVPNDTDTRMMYIGVDGGTVEGTCRIQNSETDAYDLWFSPKGGVFANGAIELTGSRVSYIALRDDAQVGSISGAQVGAVFGDGSAARTLTLKNGTTTIAIKDVAAGKNADRPISLVIDGAVTMNGSIDGVSGTITVKDCDATIKSMGEYSGTMTLENASRFTVTNPSANLGTINVTGGTMTIAAGFEGTVNVSEGAALKLVVTEQQMASGYTASAVMLPDGDNIIFVQQDGTAVPNECSGITMQAGGNTWTAKGENNWSDAANWSAGHAPAEGENAVIAIDGETTINLPSEAVSLNLLAINGSGSLTFAGSTRITCATLDVNGTVTASTAQMKPTAIVVNENAILNYEVLEETSISGISGLGKVVKTGTAKLILRNPSATGYAIESATLEVNDGVADFRTDESGTPAESQVGDVRFRDATIIIGENGSLSNYGWLKIPDSEHTLTIKTDVDGKSFMSSNGQRLQGDGSFIKAGSGLLNIQGKIDVATTITEGSLAMTNESQIGAVSGSGTLVIPQAVSATGAGAISCPVTGQGTLCITSNCASGAAVTALQNSNDWTGCVLMDGIGSIHANIVNNYGNANSRVAFKNVTFSDAGVTSNVNIELVDTGSDSTHSLKYGGNYTRNSSFGALSGTGDFYLSGFDWWAGQTKWSFSDAANFKGSITFAGDTKSVYIVAVGSADGVTTPSNNNNTFSGIVKVDAGKTLGVGGTITSKNISNIVNGTLKVWTSTAAFNGPATTFGSGSKIDLSENGSMLAFDNAPSGTTMVIVGDREIAVGDQLIAWESIPEDFTANLAHGSLALEPRETGLYVVNRGPATIVATDWNFNAFTLNGVSTTMIDGDTVEIPSTLERNDYTEWHATDGNDKLAGHAILANSSMNWKWSIKRMTIGSGVSIYAYGTSGTVINDGALIDGAGTFSLNGNQALTVNGSAVISCGVDAAGGNFKLAEGASLTVNAALADGKVTTDVAGKVVKKVVNEGEPTTYTYSLVAATPDAPITPDEGEIVIPVVPETGIAVEPGADVKVPTDTDASKVDVVYVAEDGTKTQLKSSGYVTVTVNSTTGAIELTATEDAKPTVSAMAMPTTQEEGDQVSLTITPIPGLFYSIVTCDTPNGTFTGGDGEQATNDAAKTLSIAMPDAPVKFFKVRVKATK